MLELTFTVNVAEVVVVVVVNNVVVEVVVEVFALLQADVTKSNGAISNKATQSAQCFMIRIIFICKLLFPNMHKKDSRHQIK
jgi:hypothetical protein